MISQRYSLFVSTFCNLLAQYFSNVIYHELNGDISNSELNFSIYLDSFEGHVIFGRDSRDKFHLKFARLLKEKTKVSLFYNDRVGSLEIENICECEECPVKNLNFILLFSRNIFSVKCNNGPKINFKMLSIQKNSYKRRYYKFPISKNYGHNGKIDIWMANIGPFRGYEDVEYPPFNVQLKGCLEYFIYNNKFITIINGEDQFTAPCRPVKLTEVIDYGTRSIERIVTANMFDCSLSIVNKTYCKMEDLHTYKGTYQTYYRIGKENKPVKLTFKWKQNFKKNYCLLELTMKDKTTILFTIDINYQIFLTIRNDTTGELNIEMLREVEFHKNILFLDFGSTRYLKISSGSYIYWYEKNVTWEPILIKVGKSRHSQCVEYEGPYDFQYNSSLFKIQKDELVVKNFATFSWKLIKKLEYQIIVIVILLMIATNFIWVLYTFRKPKLQKPDSDSNIYENQYGMEVTSFSLVAQRNHINSGVYESFPDIQTSE